MGVSKQYRLISCLKSNTAETNALLKLIHMSKREIEEGKLRPLVDARSDLNQRILGQRRKNA